MLKKRIALYALIIATLTISFSNLMGKGGLSPTPWEQTPNLDRFFTCFYHTLASDSPKPNYEVFKKALTGFFNLKAEKKIKNNLLTIIDFSLSSNLERLWIVDMLTMKVVHYSLVAHGRNSGDEFASSFSNIPSSYQSSIGFYLTDKVYQGKHGTSLYLDGVEPNVNDKARERAIVMHSASYVSKDFIRNNGRLGRSFGCPSIPEENHEKIITMLSGGSCIYIYYPDKKYHSTSPMYSADTAIVGIYSLLSETSLDFDFYPEATSIAENF
jgi:hypothetical protein